MRDLIKRNARSARPQSASADAGSDRAAAPRPAPQADRTAEIVAAAKASRAAGAGPRARSCLIVDDSRMIRKMARRIVEGLGYEVLEAENGEEGIARCATAMPQLVLTDWDMPVMSGPQFVEALRALPDGANAKVVFCTSKSDSRDIYGGIAAGADDYVVKPFDELGLRRKLEALGAA